MSTLAQLTSVFRSKNAGPFMLTIDLMFPDRRSFRRVADSGALSLSAVASRFGVDEAQVRIIPFDAVNTIKVTLPRWEAGSGAPGDRDVYGAQSHAPLLDLEIP